MVMPYLDFESHQRVDEKLEQLKHAHEALMAARETKNLSQFDVTVGNVRSLVSQLNNLVPLSAEEALAARERWPRGTDEVTFLHQVCFNGKGIADMRKNLVHEAREEGLLPQVETLRINIWSSPRNVSTALMRSFEQRSDTFVVDEPLYGTYLHLQAERAAAHPQASEVIGSMLSDGERVINEIILGEYTVPVVFFKQMTHHLYLTHVPHDFLKSTANVILTRDPRDMIPSLSLDLKKNLDIHDTGYQAQCELIDELISFGQDPIVIDARALLEAPETVLSSMCERLGIAFEDSMLEWPSGPSAFDGIWGKYWYSNVNRSSSFGSYQARTVPCHLKALVEECMPFYEQLLAKSRKR
jgi:hypothetical protein